MLINIGLILSIGIALLIAIGNLSIRSALSVLFFMAMAVALAAYAIFYA